MRMTETIMDFAQEQMLKLDVSINEIDKKIGDEHKRGRNTDALVAKHRHCIASWKYWGGVQDGKIVMDLYFDPMAETYEAVNERINPRWADERMYREAANLLLGEQVMDVEPTGFSIISDLMSEPPS